MVPETRYTRSGSISIAYQTLGDGPVDVALIFGWISNIERVWEEPRFARFLSRLASFSRLILFDKRGTGLSDRPTDTPTLEERMEDLHAVLDAVESESAFVMGYSEGGPMCALFAATYPERTRGLVMMGSYPRRYRCEGFPIGPDKAEIDAFIDAIEANWGGPFAIEARAPSVANDPKFLDWWARFLRSSTSPAAAKALTTANMQIDVRDILPAIKVPTLLVHAVGDRTCSVDFSRYMVRRIPGAQLVEIDSEDHLPWLQGSDAIVLAIEEFVTGSRHEKSVERVLCTIMFTDIVGSTEIIARSGDENWRDVLSSHNTIVRQDLETFQGRELNTTGDGFVAVFDGPARAIRCAQSISGALSRIGIELRIGLHCGECEVQGDDVAGLALHIAARIMDQATSGEIIVSRTVKDLVAGSGIQFDNNGVHLLKGVPDEWQLYRVAG